MRAGLSRRLQLGAVFGAAAVALGMLGATPAAAIPIPGGAVDMTGGSSATIAFPGGEPSPAYSPKLLAVGRVGTGLAELQWSGSSFVAHPLRFEDISVAGQSSGSATTRNLRSGRYAYYCAIHGGPGGAGMSGELYVAGPRAALKSVPADVAPGGAVTLDAAASDLVSYSGGALTYAFDPEGDGTFLPPGSASSLQATYPAQGTVTARVRVTDEAGRVDDAAFDIDVAPPGTTPPPPTDPPGDPANPGSPASTTGPGGATTKPGGTRRAIRFADVATLPRFGRCVNRRRGVRIRVRDAAGGDVRRVRVLVNGRAVRSRSVARSATLTVRPLPRGRPLVRVVVTLAGGKTLSRSTRYRVCRG